MSLNVKVDYTRIPQKLYRLRWRFTYSDGKPDVYGVWDENSKHPANKASYQDKNNLKTAIIEGECRMTKAIIPLIEIDGHKMRHVRCEAWGSMGAALRTNSPNKVELRPRLHSMFFQTDDEILGVAVDGKTMARSIIGADKFKSFEHSAGV